jgi:hypothetical protein
MEVPPDDTRSWSDIRKGVLARWKARPSWAHKPIEKLTDRQIDYVSLLETTFKIKDAFGRVANYVPMWYQIDFHASFILAEPDAPTRFVQKSRGMGYTAMTSMDFLMFAHRYNGVTVPMASDTLTGATTPIAWLHWLAENTRIPDFFSPDVNRKSTLRLDNGSEVRPIPGGSPKTFRTIRAPIVAYDEFAFCPHPKDLMTAGNGCMTEGGQQSIFSTPNGKDNEYWRLYEESERLGYRVFYVPAFNPKRFHPESPIPDQVKDGLAPVAPWHDLRKLEEDRMRDPIAFMQEHMCSPVDAGLKLLPWELLVKRSLLPEGLKPTYPCYLGVDFAYSQDLSAWVILEDTPPGLMMRLCAVLLRKTDTVDQNLFLDELMNDYPISAACLDSTGAGLGLYHYARRKHGSLIRGVNFARKITQDNNRVPIKRAMARAIRSRLVDCTLLLLKDMEIVRDLNTIEYEKLDAPRTSRGHGDRFWATCLAIEAAYPVMRGDVTEVGDVDDILPDTNEHYMSKKRPFRPGIV